MLISHCDNTKIDEEFTNNYSRSTIIHTSIIVHSYYNLF